MNNLSTNVRLLKPYTLKTKTESFRLTQAKGEAAREWLSNKNAPKWIELTDDDGRYIASVDKITVIALQYDKTLVHANSTARGYYCEWGAYHYADDAPCKHFVQTGVPPWFMVQKRKELYPNWADGEQGRPLKSYNGNAMTKTMADTIMRLWHGGV